MLKSVSEAGRRFGLVLKEQKHSSGNNYPDTGVPTVCSALQGGNCSRASLSAYQAGSVQPIALTSADSISPAAT